MIGRNAHSIALLLLALQPGAALALQAMSETDMSAVTGQDGLSAVLSSSSITAATMRLDVDSAEAVLAGSNAYLDFDNVTLTGVGADGVGPGAAFTLTTGLDAGANASGDPYLALDAAWSRSRFQVGAVHHENQTTNSIGSFAFDSSGSLSLFNQGILNGAAANNANLRLNITDGIWWYRQSGSEFVWDNMNIDVGFDGGTLEADASGIKLSAARFDYNILFDVGFRENPGTAFQTAGALPILRYGWEGGLTDFELSINGGGVWYGGDINNRSEGINISFRNNYDTDFAWIIGDAGGNETQLKFTDWVNLPGAASALNVPNLTLDVINANQGPGAINYLGTNYNIAPENNALAVILRDVSFLSYNTRVTLIDNPFPTRDYGWALIYTLGDLDANIYLYPGGLSSSEGIKFDALVALQSPGAWNANSHFLIADSDAGVGIGFVNTDFLVSIDNAYLELVTDGGNGTCGNCGLRLNATAANSDFRWELQALFGGGTIADLSDPVKISDLDLVLHADTLDLLFSPPEAGDTRIRFDWSARLVNDSYISLSEPSRPDVDFRLGAISGDIAARNGVIDLRSGNETADNLPRLVFEQDLQFGITAGTAPLRIDDLSLGSNNIGALAIPGGQWRGVFALKEQL